MKRIEECSFNAQDFVDHTQKSVVYATFKRPKRFSYDNPDPYGFFPGRKGDSNFYLIRWSDDLTEYTNCYAFACGWTVKDRKFNGIYQPGFLSGLEPENLGEYVEAITKDLKAVGREVYEVYDAMTCPKKLPKAKDGSYWIKLVFAGDDRFHMLRKDENTGKWIHKAGWSNQPKVLLRFKFDEKSGSFETKYETKDTADYVGYNKAAGTFIGYKFAYAMRIQK